MPGRGWDIGEVRRLCEESNIEVAWLQPKFRGRTAQWQGEWWKRPLWTAFDPDTDDETDGQQHVEWVTEVSRTSVCWTGTLTTKGVLKKADQTILQGQIELLSQMQLSDKALSAQILRQEGLPDYPLEEDPASAE